MHIHTPAEGGTAGIEEALLEAWVGHWQAQWAGMGEAAGVQGGGAERPQRAGVQRGQTEWPHRSAA